MHKLLWVALPLLVAAVLLAVQVLRRRPPSRLALNVGSSVLLLVYLATTAGLGLFWVANQQLPVFDWHYLFGYMTVLLVALHLVFNLRIVWRYVTRRRVAEPVPRAASDAGAPRVRRHALAAVGVLLASGGAYLLGLRHGRVAVTAEGAAVSHRTDASASALAAIERYHAMTSHSRAGVLLRAPAVVWGDPPPSFKSHAATAERFALPPPRSAPGAPDSVSSLAAVLWHTAGITATRGPLKLRASPSSGALFSTELYVAARSVSGLAPGLWHYDPAAHALVRLPGEADAGDAHALVIATAVFRRSGHKYRDRTYRYVLADLGHALENLRVAAAATGGRADFVMRFDESRIAAALGLDEGEEGVLALLALTSMKLPPALSAELLWSSLAADAPTRAEPLGVTNALHRASSLRSAVPPIAAPSEAAAPPEGTAGAIALPSAPATRQSALDVIAARRSVRRFAPGALPLEAVSAVLDAMDGRGTPPLSPGVRVSVVAHAVAGLPSGVYRYEPAQHALLPRRSVPTTELRAAAGAAALDQSVISDAAVVFVLSIARAGFAADASGPARGYRHAFLEAGRVGERIYLEAGARGLGACAVGAFYDDEASALVTIDPAREWVVHFVALGLGAE